MKGFLINYKNFIFSHLSTQKLWMDSGVIGQIGLHV